MAEQEQIVDGAAPGAAAAAAAGATPAVVDPAATPAERPWYERRLDTVTANWRQTERALADERSARVAAESALEAAKKGGTVVPPTGSPEFEAAVNARAGAQAMTLAFNQRCNRIAGEGLAKFPDFDTSVATWKRLGDLTVPIVEAADETGHAAEIIYELGKNPAEAERILKLTPVQQIAAVVKFGQKFAAAAPLGATRTGAVSDAPPPIKVAVGGGGAKVADPSLYETDKLTTRQWIEKREAELAATRAKRRA